MYMVERCDLNITHVIKLFDLVHGDYREGPRTTLTYTSSSDLARAVLERKGWNCSVQLQNRKRSAIFPCGFLEPLCCFGLLVQRFIKSHPMGTLPALAD